MVCQCKKKCFASLSFASPTFLCLYIVQPLLKTFSVVLLFYKCVGCFMHLYIMYFEKKNTILLFFFFFFYSPEWMPRFHSWFKIDARLILSDPIKIFHSHSNFSELTHIPTVVLRCRNRFETWRQNTQTFAELSYLLLTLRILQDIYKSSQM